MIAAIAQSLCIYTYIIRYLSSAWSTLDSLSECARLDFFLDKQAWDRRVV